MKPFKVLIKPFEASQRSVKIKSPGSAGKGLNSLMMIGL